MWETILFFGLALVSLALFLIRFRLLSKAMKWVGVAHGVNVLSLVIGQIMKMKGSTNNLFIFHFALILIYAAYATAFYYAIATTRFRQIVLVSIGVFTLAALGFMATIQPLVEYNSYALTLANLLLPCWSLMYLYRLFSEVKIASLERDPFFWVSIGLLFTSLANFFGSGLMSYLIHESRDYAYKVYMLEETMTILLFAILGVAVMADKLFKKA
ncbi:MAG: hypothetical protein EOO39_01780 [Cytophagaceae bacterium]|nr:MAG: hypothetical protein EOO39_01780 [Cytophagaceae bacterium]